jgi:hypothetical protein
MKKRRYRVKGKMHRLKDDLKAHLMRETTTKVYNNMFHLTRVPVHWEMHSFRKAVELMVRGDMDAPLTLTDIIVDRELREE